MDNEFLVPVEPVINDFREHLMCHPRTILSAKFGDGKSYFIDAFIHDKEVMKKFQFIKLYPVNYQVLENQDIFDVIKYDILLQMGLNDMLDESTEISSRDAFVFCLKTNGLDLIESLFDVSGNMEGFPQIKAIGKIGKALSGVVKKIHETVKEYKKYKAGEIGIIDDYIKDIDKVSIYEEDLVTKIIQNGIASWRKKRGNSKKRVCLLIEDMDRIDPAHLFRILNIFSAHMDFVYRYGVSPDSSLAGNKFGFDNVVLVIHYDNLKSIFHHFYGNNTCFEGYIHKFADKEKFEYSLKEETSKYYYRCLQTLTGISIDSLKQALPEDKISDKTLRELSNSLDVIREQCKEVDGKVYGLVIMMVCMRRLDMSDQEIVGNFHKVVYSDMRTWLIPLYPYLKHFNMLNGESIYLSDNQGRKYGFYFETDGDMLRIEGTSVPTSGPFLKVGEFLYKVLALVIR